MKKLLTLALIATFMTGCAGSFKPITTVDLTQYKSLEADSLIVQEEIDKKVILSNGGASAGAQFGFIGSLIGSIVDASVNSSVAEQAEKDMAPIRNSLADYDARAIINANLSSQLNQVKWVDASEFKSISLGNDSVSTTDVTLGISTTYKLSEDLSYLEISSVYSLYNRDDTTQKTKKDKKTKKAIYTNSAIYQSSAIIGKAKEELQTVWSTNGGELLKSTIEEGAKQVAEMIVLDLNGEGVRSEEEQKKSKNKELVLSSNDSGRSIIRSVNGTLMSTMTLK